MPTKFTVNKYDLHVCGWFSFERYVPSSSRLQYKYSEIDGKENKRRFTFGNLVIRGNLPWQRALYFASLFSEKGEVTADV